LGTWDEFCFCEEHHGKGCDSPLGLVLGQKTVAVTGSDDEGSSGAGGGAGGGRRESVAFKKVPRLRPLFFLICRLYCSCSVYRGLAVL
jgi:hypothetical protein